MPCNHRAFFYCLSFLTAFGLAGFSGSSGFGGSGGRGTSLLFIAIIGGGGGTGGGAIAASVIRGGGGGGAFCFSFCAIATNEAVTNKAANITFLFMQVGLS